MTYAKVLFLPYKRCSPEPALRYRLLRSPVFAALGLRPPAASHTRDEHRALRRWARGCRMVVEIGVHEGASAVALREGMSPEGTLHLIDPFVNRRWALFNPVRAAARRAVSLSGNGMVRFVEEFSRDAASASSEPIDLLFIDGDHRYEAVLRDWRQWHTMVASGGLVVFHDAREFPGGFVTEQSGPLRVVRRLFTDGETPGWTVFEEVDSLVAVRREA